MILNAPSGNSRCIIMASSAGASIQASISSSVVRMWSVKLETGTNRATRKQFLWEAPFESPLNLLAPLQCTDRPGLPVAGQYYMPTRLTYNAFRTLHRPFGVAKEVQLERGVDLLSTRSDENNTIVSESNVEARKKLSRD
jgi:hypothetical protein